MDFAFSEYEKEFQREVQAFIQEHVDSDVKREYAEFRAGQPRGPHLKALYEKLQLRGWIAISCRCSSCRPTRR